MPCNYCCRSHTWTSRWDQVSLMSGEKVGVTSSRTNWYSPSTAQSCYCCHDSLRREIGHTIASLDQSANGDSWPCMGRSSSPGCRCTWRRQRQTHIRVWNPHRSLFPSTGLCTRHWSVAAGRPCTALSGL
jgi:hypothetical protein